MSDEKASGAEIPLEDEFRPDSLVDDPDDHGPSVPPIGVALSVLWWVEGEIDPRG